MTYDLTLFNSTNARTNLQLVTGVNSASSGLLGVLIFFTLYLVFFIMFRKAGLDGVDNFIASSFITTGFGVLLFLVGILDWSMLAISFSIMIISLIIKFVK